MAKRGFGGGMMPGNMNNLLKQAQKMQENMQKMQAELEAKEIESSVGGGAVTVKVNGKKELIDIKVINNRRYFWLNSFPYNDEYANNIENRKIRKIDLQVKCGSIFFLFHRIFLPLPVETN